MPGLSTIRTGLLSLQKPDNGILSAALTVSFLTALVKLAGGAKVLFIAHYFGIRDDLDAFLIAFLLPSFFADTCATSVTAALIPTLVEERQQHGQAASQRLAASIVVWTLLLLALGTAITAFAAEPVLRLLGSGFPPVKLALTHSLLLWLLPILPITAIGATLRAILNSTHDYAVASIAPIAAPAATMVAVIAGAGDWGVYSLVYGSLAGSAIEVLFLLWGLGRRGMLAVPGVGLLDEPTRRVLRQYAPMLGSALLMSASTLVSQSMAAMLGPGSVSALSYGAKLVNVMLALGPLAIGTASLPHFSHMMAEGAREQTWRTFRQYARLILLVTIPATAVLIAISQPVVHIFFERGEFTSADTAIVSQVQRYYLLQLPVAMLGALAARLISSFKSNDTLLWGALVAVGAQVALTRALLPALNVSGVALAASASSFIYLCYLLAVLSRWNRAAISSIPPPR